MMNTILALKIPNAPVRRKAYAVPEWTAQGRHLTRTDETDWAALLIAVRDRQDRAAFAALFRHFAPRVKAFLMKSGTDAALAAAVFGVPTFEVDGRLFWRGDALPMVAAYLKGGPW